MATTEATNRLPEREHLIAELDGAGYLNDPLLEEAMLAVPRHLFLPEELWDAAYEDRPLPVGHGQTVSAPHMVAMMTTALQLEPGDRVLEIGGGVGYHAAVVKAVVGAEGEVITVEYLPELAELARGNLERAGADVRLIQGDGFRGHPEGAPYDAILVTCAIPKVPQTFIEQLREGGHIVAPIGVTRCQLMAARKVDGALEGDDLGSCLFVNAQGRLGANDLDDDGPIRPSV